MRETGNTEKNPKTEEETGRQGDAEKRFKSNNKSKIDLLDSGVRRNNENTDVVIPVKTGIQGFSFSSFVILLSLF